MLKDCNIAFFIDVDNVGLKSENYFNVIEQLSAMGKILCGKIYGAGERKHKEIYADAQLHGYKVERPMRVKRRGRKEFDPRIFVDAVDAVARTPAIDAVCIIAQPTDLVYLYSYLRGRGVRIIALDNADDASCALVDEVIDLGIVLELKLPETTQSKPAKRTQTAVDRSATGEPSPTAESLDRTDELLREIERLKDEVSIPEPEQVSEQPVEQPRDQDVSPQTEQTPQDTQNTSIVDETRSLLERIAEIHGNSPEQTAEQPAKPVEQPTEQTPVAQAEPTAPRAPYSATNDGDLIRRIEEIRKNSQGGDEDFIEEIRKLLDGLE